MTIRAKFKVDSIEITQGVSYPNTIPVDYSKGVPVELRTIKMSAVYGNNDPNHENTKFWAATPHGSLQLGTINPGAWAQFEIGKEYYLDFTPTD